MTEELVKLIVSSPGGRLLPVESSLPDEFALVPLEPLLFAPASQ